MLRSRIFFFAHSSYVSRPLVHSVLYFACFRSPSKHRLHTSEWPSCLDSLVAFSLIRKCQAYRSSLQGKGPIFSTLHKYAAALSEPTHPTLGFNYSLDCGSITPNLQRPFLAGPPLNLHAYPHQDAAFELVSMPRIFVAHWRSGRHLTTDQPAWLENVQGCSQCYR